MFLAHLNIGLNVILLPFPRETKEVSPFKSNRNLDLSFWRYNELPISCTRPENRGNHYSASRPS